MNFNHNDYFDKIKKNMGNNAGAQAPTHHSELRGSQLNAPNINNQYEQIEVPQNRIQRGASAIQQNRNQIVSGLSSTSPNKRNRKSQEFIRQLSPFMRAASTQNLNSHLMKR